MDDQKKEGPHAANVGAGNTTGLDGEVSQATVPVQAAVSVTDQRLESKAAGFAPIPGCAP